MIVTYARQNMFIIQATVNKLKAIFNFKIFGEMDIFKNIRAWQCHRLMRVIKWITCGIMTKAVVEFLKCLLHLIMAPMGQCYKTFYNRNF